jgi:hypothetical protein
LAEARTSHRIRAAGTPHAATGRPEVRREAAEEQYAPKGKALYSAVYHRHYEIAKLLLERGAFPNPPVESSGDALWMVQKWRPDKRMEELLLSYGARP